MRPRERRASLGGRTDVFVKHVLEARPRHRSTFGIDEQLRRSHRAAHAQPGADIAGGLFPERQASLLAALAADHHARRSAERDVFQQDADQLGDAQAAGEAEMHHRPIPHTRSCRQVGRVQDRAHLVHGQMADELLVVALDRNGLDLPHLLQRRWHMMLDVAHERLDGGEPQIAGGGAISPLPLDVREEVRR